MVSHCEWQFVGCEDCHVKNRKVRSLSHNGEDCKRRRVEVRAEAEGARARRTLVWLYV